MVIFYSSATVTEKHNQRVLFLAHDSSDTRARTAISNLIVGVLSSATNAVRFKAQDNSFKDRAHQRSFQAKEHKYLNN